jgi:hypothetical protein
MTLTASREIRDREQFFKDQERARQQIATLEEQARVYLENGKHVPAAAHMRTAHLLRWMWCIK